MANRLAGGFQLFAQEVDFLIANSRVYFLQGFKAADFRYKAGFHLRQRLFHGGPCRAAGRILGTMAWAVRRRMLEHSSFSRSWGRALDRSRPLTSTTRRSGETGR